MNTSVEFDGAIHMLNVVCLIKCIGKSNPSLDQGTYPDVALIQTKI